MTEDSSAGVLDWELAHAGYPAEDLVWACVWEWHSGEDELLVLADVLGVDELLPSQRLQ